MSNDRLKAALAEAGLEPEQLAEIVEVDEKSIGRWLAGATTPYRRHRARVARALGREPHELWPDSEPPTPVIDEPATDEQAAGGGELLAIYPSGSDQLSELWSELLATATERIDLLDDTLGHIIDRDTIAELARLADAGCEIRVLVSDRESIHLTISELERDPAAAPTWTPPAAWDTERTLGYLQPILSHPHVHARAYTAAGAGSILRVDEQLLLSLPLHGTPAVDGPLLHLARHDDGGLFDRYAHHYDAIWTIAQPAAEDPDLYPDPDEHPDRYEPEPPSA